MTYSNRWNRLVYALWSPIYDVLLKIHPVHRARAQAFELADIRSYESVLFVGIGTGADLRHLSGTSLTVGIDLSISMLRRSYRVAKQLKSYPVLVCGDAMRLPFQGQTFDVVVLNLIVSVVSNPNLCLQEANRVLRPSGRVVVSDKFLPSGQTATISRRLLNVVTRFFGTDINRSWQEISDNMLDTKTNEPVGLAGSARVIIATPRR